MVEDEVEEEENVSSKNATLDQTDPSLVVTCLRYLSSLASRVSLTLRSDPYMALVEVAVEFAKITSIRKSRLSTQLVEHSDALVKEMWEEAYSILGGLTSTIHGGSGEGISLVAKALLPLIMMTCFPAVTTTIPKEISAARKRSLAFLLASGKNGEKTSNDALQLLMQHICIQVPDKAEYRHMAHKTIGEILEKSASTTVKGEERENQNSARFVNFLLKYGRHTKPGYRLFAIEVAEELLLNSTFVVPTELRTVVKKKATKGKNQKSRKTAQSPTLTDSIELENIEDEARDSNREGGVGSNQAEADREIEKELLILAASMDIDQSLEVHGNENAEERNNSTHKIRSGAALEGQTVVFSEEDHFELLTLLAEFLLERSSDKVVAVRAKAISALATSLEQVQILRSDSLHSVASHYERAIRKVYFEAEKEEKSENLESNKSSKGTMDVETKATSSAASHAKSKSSLGHENAQPSLISLIKRRLEDERSTVRKSALQLLETFCRFDKCASLEQSWLDLFKNSCFDPLLIIRKQAALSLTALATDFSDVKILCSTWVQSVPVLAFDTEQSVQEASLHAFVDIVVSRILDTKSDREKKSTEGKNKKKSENSDENNPKINYVDNDPVAWNLFVQVTLAGSDTSARTLAKLAQMMVSTGESVEYRREARSLIKFLALVLRSIQDILDGVDIDTNDDGEKTKLYKDVEIACWKAMATFGSLPSFASNLDLGFVLESWNRVKGNDKVNVDTKLRILQTLGTLVGEIKNGQKVFDDLLERLEDFSVTPPIIQASTQLLVKLTDKLCSNGDGASQQKTRNESAAKNIAWMTRLLAVAESTLGDIIVPSDQGQISTAFKSFTQLEAVLFTAGEIAQFLPKANVPQRLVTLLQTFISSTFKGVVVGRSHSEVEAQGSKNLNFSESESLHPMSVEEDQAKEKDSSVANEDDELVVDFGKGRSSAAAGRKNKSVRSTSKSVLLNIPASTKALAYVSLGKLCLQDFTLAKTCIAAFARELEISPSFLVRNNVMVVMCDLVVRYSNLVDNYLSKLTICLRDENEMVRRQTLVMLTNLLQEEFIKLRQGNLFFPLLLTLVDDSEVLRQFSLVCFENIISKQVGLNSNLTKTQQSNQNQSNNIFFSNFIEAIFFLNDFRGHPSYNQYHYSARERQVFNLSGGGRNRARRFTIYKIFFDHMEDQHKYQISFRLCDEILQNFLDGQIPFSESAQHLLYDVLCILSSDEIRLKNISSRIGKAASGAREAASSELSGEAGEVVASEDDVSTIESQKKLVEATGHLAAQVVKKTTIERIVPIFIDLKGYLAKNHSPLLKQVMQYLSNLIKEMPDEMAEVLDFNPQLAMELAYETRLQRTIRENKERMLQRGEKVTDDHDDDAKDGEEISTFTRVSQRPRPRTHVAASYSSLSAAAAAPTPWKRMATELAEFAVPKLKTGSAPYRPSPANAPLQSIASASHSSSSTVISHVPSTPKTPKAAGKNISSAPKVLPPNTPGDISSPMVNKMRRTSMIIRTPSKSTPAEKGERSDEQNEVSETSSKESASNANINIEDAENESRKAKRPRYADDHSDSDSVEETENVASNPQQRAKKYAKKTAPGSPTMAKAKPVAKRPKVTEKKKKEEDEESDAIAAALLALSSPVKPAKTKAKRKRHF